MDNARYALRMGLRTNYLPHSSLASTWDAVQETFGCCGVDNLLDWHWIAAWPELNIVPDSCCIPEARRMPNCGKSQNAALLYPRGCFPVIRDYIMRNMYIVAIVAILIAFIQVRLVGSVFRRIADVWGCLSGERKLPNLTTLDYLTELYDVFVPCSFTDSCRRWFWRALNDKRKKAPRK